MSGQTSWPQLQSPQVSDHCQSLTIEAEVRVTPVWSNIATWPQLQSPQVSDHCQELPWHLDGQGWTTPVWSNILTQLQSPQVSDHCPSLTIWVRVTPVWSNILTSASITSSKWPLSIPDHLSQGNSCLVKHLDLSFNHLDGKWWTSHLL